MDRDRIEVPAHAAGTKRGIMRVLHGFFMGNTVAGNLVCCWPLDKFVHIVQLCTHHLEAK